MPFADSNRGSRRAGQGGGGGPVDKKFGAATQPWPTRQSGGQSAAADTTGNQRMSVGYPDADTYTSGDENVLHPRPAEYEGEAGCNSEGICSSPLGDGMMGENLLRTFIREALAFGAAPSDLDEIDLVDEDEDEQYPDKNEFSAVGGGAGGGAQLSGYTLPMGGKTGRSKTKSKGKKSTHG